MRLAALAILLLAGCATLEEEAAQVRDAWQGAFYDDVVKRWGAPNRSATLQDGSQVHTWVSESQASYGSSGPTVGVGVGGVRGGGGGVGGVGVGFGFPLGGSRAVEVSRCERTFTFRGNIVVQQSWIGDTALCNTFTR